MNIMYIILSVFKEVLVNMIEKLFFLDFNLNYDNRR